VICFSGYWISTVHGTVSMVVWGHSYMLKWFPLSRTGRAFCFHLQIGHGALHSDIFCHVSYHHISAVDVLAASTGVVRGCAFVRRRIFRPGGVGHGAGGITVLLNKTSVCNQILGREDRTGP
jgi:hypothetical protein